MNKELAYTLSFLMLLLSSLFFFNLLTPFDRKSLSRFAFLSYIIPNNSQKSPLIRGACDYSRGRWVWDETYPPQLYNENCQFLDPGFRCRQNGRKDEGYSKWRWQPDGCHLPRFNASDILERSRNGRIVFAGDSVGRNQWESLLCMLTQGVSNLSEIYEVNGNPISKHRGYLAMRFQEYNMTVEYYRAPFLSIIGRPPLNSSNEVRMTIRLDELHWYSNNWAGADVLIFNSGHWWNPDKTIKTGIYFQERGMVNMTMNVKEAFRRSLQTWKSWAFNSLDPKRSFVFFRSYSSVHYRQVKTLPGSHPIKVTIYELNKEKVGTWGWTQSNPSSKFTSDNMFYDLLPENEIHQQIFIRNGTWNEGGNCDMETEPEKDPTKLELEPYYNTFISDVVKQMQYGSRKVQFLNITYLSELRKDGHPSKYREPGTPPEAPQDCSHWCLPGVPDTWNELLYAQLLSKKFGINKNFSESGEQSQSNFYQTTKNV